ncbi:MAG: hypothetical protein ACR2N4_07985 [Jatrophihabitans sp.]
MTALALGLSMLLAAGVGWLVLRPAHPGRASGQAIAGSGPPSQDDVGAVMRLLQRHAGELISRDGSGWTADLDATPAAAGYATRQRAVFDNLAGVPLANWRYVLSAPVTDPTVIAPAAARLGARVVLLHVQLQYGFAVVDPAPTAKDLWLTAVRRPAGWRLAGDTDAASTGGPSWQGPWDFGPLRASVGPHTLVLAHPAHAGDARTFQALVEHSVPVVGAVWGNNWNEHVAVLIPDTPAEFTAVTGDGADSHDIAAVAVADSVTGDGTVLGARIVLNPTNLSRLDQTGRTLVVQHELTHIATRAQTSDQMPTWLIEGFADYVGNLGSGQPLRTAATELAAEVRRGRLPTALPNSADFDGANSRLAQIYEQSWLACRLIASKVGQQGLVSFYRTVSRAAGIDAATAATQGLRQVLHTDVAAFTAAWRRWLQVELR